MIHQLIEDAYKILDGIELSRELICNIAKNINHSDILDLLSLANKTRKKFASNELHICSIVNAKSGLCPENCKFCAQSAHNNTQVETYSMMSTEEILKNAKETLKSGVDHFGIVTSGTGYKTPTEEFENILKTIDTIHKNLPELKVCASLGNLSLETAELLSKHDIAHYNINLQTAPSKYSELIANTHTVTEKIQTVKYLKKFNIKVCCGGILGVGEDLNDDIEMAYTLKDLDVDVIPLNILIPIDGTPLEGQEHISAANAAKIFSIFRLINPAKTIKFAAGRETVMSDFQALLMLSGTNGMLSGGYLTTRGREVKQDKVFSSELNNF